MVTLVDSSGNGFDLSSNGSPSTANSTTKFDDGYSLDGTDDEFFDTGSKWNFTGAVSFTFAVDIDSFTNTTNPRFVFQNDDGGGKHFDLWVKDDGSIGYNDDTVSAPSTTGTINTGFNSFWVKRDSSGNVTIKVYESDGTISLNETITTNASASDDGGPYELYFASSNGANYLQGALYELRVWDSAVSDSTLDNIADPSVTGSSGYETEAEGSEYALYYAGDKTLSADASNTETSHFDFDGDGSELVTLDGTLSSSPDTITDYLWEEDTNSDGTYDTILSSGSSATQDVTLSTGTHDIRLTVTDSNSDTATDTIIVNINPGKSVTQKFSIGPNKSDSGGTKLTTQKFSIGQSKSDSSESKEITQKFSTTSGRSDVTQTDTTTQKFNIGYVMTRTYTANMSMDGFTEKSGLENIPMRIDTESFVENVLTTNINIDLQKFIESSKTLDINIDIQPFTAESFSTTVTMGVLPYKNYKDELSFNTQSLGSGIRTNYPDASDGNLPKYNTNHPDLVNPQLQLGYTNEARYDYGLQMWVFNKGTVNLTQQFTWDEVTSQHKNRVGKTVQKGFKKAQTNQFMKKQPNISSVDKNQKTKKKSKKEWQQPYGL